MDQKVPEDREWLSYKEAQLVSGRGRTTLWKLVGSGSILAARCGRSVCINRASLESYMWSRVPEGKPGTTVNGRLNRVGDDS